jgi:hypothetical protein
MSVVRSAPDPEPRKKSDLQRRLERGEVIKSTARISDILGGDGQQRGDSVPASNSGQTTNENPRAHTSRTFEEATGRRGR